MSHVNELLVKHVKELAAIADAGDFDQLIEIATRHYREMATLARALEGQLEAAMKAAGGGVYRQDRGGGEE